MPQEPHDELAGQSRFVCQTRQAEADVSLAELEADDRQHHATDDHDLGTQLFDAAMRDLEGRLFPAVALWVADRGFSSDANLAYLRRAGGHWIAGERMRDGSADAQEALSRQGRYQAVRDDLRVKEVRLERTPDRRWIVCHNPDEAERDKAQRDAAVARLDAELAAIKAARARDAARAKKTRRKVNDDAHRKAECALRDDPTLGRYLRQTTTGRLQINRSAIRAEERLDGKYLLSTSDPDLSAEDVALGYKNLLEAERGFRDLKSTLELRPVFHRLEPRIRAHGCCAGSPCSSSGSPNAAAAPPGGASPPRWAASTPSPSPATAGTVIQTTPPSDTAAGFLTACGIDPLPRITHLHPA